MFFRILVNCSLLFAEVLFPQLEPIVPWWGLIDINLQLRHIDGTILKVVAIEQRDGTWLSRQL